MDGGVISKRHAQKQQRNQMRTQMRTQNQMRTQKLVQMKYQIRILRPPRNCNLKYHHYNVY